MRNNFYLAAGVVCLFTAILHTVGGQLSLVDPLLASELDLQVKSEWLGAWHIVTVMLWVFSIYLLRNGWKVNPDNHALMKAIALLNLLFGLVFIGSTIVQQTHTPQYILILPIAALTYWGIRKEGSSVRTNAKMVSRVT